MLESGIVNSLATFQAPDGLLIGAGQPSGNYVPVEGYVGIQCMDAPTSIARITADEAKTEQQIESSNSGHIWLAGNYPEINDHTEWRAVVTGANSDVTIYDVLGAEGDSQGKTTRVKVNVSTV